VFRHLEALVDDLVSVDDAQTTAALTLILERSKLMVEPAGAVGVAALLEGALPPKVPDPVVVVLSGGNIDLLLLGEVVRHGLEGSGRYAAFRVWIPDRPGQLVKVLNLIAAEGGNVVQVEHHREGFGLPFGVVEVNVNVETRGPEVVKHLRTALEPFSPGHR
ncbi:MAG: pyridoxal-phosphate dependent enzyme, partial [Acidimicrobiia bacterium]